MIVLVAFIATLFIPSAIAPPTTTAPVLFTVKPTEVIAPRFKVVAALCKLTAPVESDAMKEPTALAPLSVVPPSEVVFNTPAVIVPPVSVIAPPPYVKFQACISKVLAPKLMGAVTFTALFTNIAT